MPGPSHREPPEDVARRAANLPTGPGRAEPGSPHIEIAELRTALTATVRQRDELASRLEAGEQRITELQQRHEGQTEELGRLRAVAETVGGLTSERDALRARVTELQERLPARIEEQVTARLTDLTKAHVAEVTALKRERDQLRERLVDLEKQPADETGPAMTTSALAGHFAGVLSELAEQPQQRPDSAYTASVTGFSVTAKGLLRATESGDVELVTPKPGTVSADQLSTLNMDLKLLPRLPGAGPTA